jgi:hypothetical protein
LKFDVNKDDSLIHDENYLIALFNELQKQKIKLFKDDFGILIKKTWHKRLEVKIILLFNILKRYINELKDNKIPTNNI